MRSCIVDMVCILVVYVVCTSVWLWHSRTPDEQLTDRSCMPLRLLVNRYNLPLWENGGGGGEREEGEVGGGGRRGEGKGGEGEGREREGEGKEREGEGREKEGEGGEGEEGGGGRRGKEM